MYAGNMSGNIQPIKEIGLSKFKDWDIWTLTKSQFKTLDVIQD